MTTPPLSPAAQAVLSAFWAAPVSVSRNLQLAAALRATTEQPYSVPAHFRGGEYSMYVKGVEAERERIRSIANELDPHP
jgi:hypothetical protein